MTARVTIVMPARNAARTLDRAVRSVLGQTERNWVLIIADDASDDDTARQAAAFAETDPRITALVRGERAGFMNFGTGLREAATPYFVWLAADDYWGPRFLEAALTVLETVPAAVSALPRSRFVTGPRDIAAPRTETLDGPAEARLRRFFAAPGGTRMYGLHRTPVAQRAFPGRNINAWDWAFTATLLRAGPQIEVPETLLFREYTETVDYIGLVRKLHRSPVARAFPALPMSLAALRAGAVPRENLADLARLNLRKHEEYMAALHPGVFLRLRRIYRPLGLPMTCKPGMAADLAGRIVRRGGAPGRLAGRMLERLACEGDRSAALELGRLRRSGDLSGDAREAFRRAGELGIADGWFLEADAAREEGALDHPAFWARAVAAADCGSAEAHRFLARARATGEVPEVAAPPVRAALARLPRTRSGW